MDASVSNLFKGEMEEEGIKKPDGSLVSRLEIARILRERNEYKEKYFSLLEQIRFVSLFVGVVHLYCTSVV